MEKLEIAPDPNSPITTGPAGTGKKLPLESTRIADSSPTLEITTRVARHQEDAGLTPSFSLPSTTNPAKPLKKSFRNHITTRPPEGPPENPNRHFTDLIQTQEEPPQNQEEILAQAEPPGNAPLDSDNETDELSHQTIEKEPSSHQTRRHRLHQENHKKKEDLEIRESEDDTVSDCLDTENTPPPPKAEEEGNNSRRTQN
jgi:hypothetical protein